RASASALRLDDGRSTMPRIQKPAPIPAAASAMAMRSLGIAVPAGTVRQDTPRPININTRTTTTIAAPRRAGRDGALVAAGRASGRAELGNGPPSLRVRRT